MLTTGIARIAQHSLVHTHIATGTSKGTVIAKQLSGYKQGVGLFLGVVQNVVAVSEVMPGAGCGSPGLSKIGISIIHDDAGASSRPHGQGMEGGGQGMGALKQASRPGLVIGGSPLPVAVGSLIPLPKP